MVKYHITSNIIKYLSCFDSVLIMKTPLMHSGHTIIDFRVDIFTSRC